MEITDYPCLSSVSWHFWCTIQMRRLYFFVVFRSLSRPYMLWDATSLYDHRLLPRIIGIVRREVQRFGMDHIHCLGSPEWLVSVGDGVSVGVREVSVWFPGKNISHGRHVVWIVSPGFVDLFELFLSERCVHTTMHTEEMDCNTMCLA